MSFTALALIKISFLIFYRFVFVYDKSRFLDWRNIVINSMIFIIVIWDLGFTITFLSAWPKNFKAHWSTTTSKEITSQCINTFDMMWALSISDFITDVIIILIPIPMIWRLYLPLGRKLGVLLIFLLGSLYVEVKLQLYFDLRLHYVQGYGSLSDKATMDAQNHI